MKKFVILIFLCTILFIGGCSYGKESQAMKSLNAQIDNIEQTVSDTSTSEVMDVSPSITIDANTTLTSLQNYKATAYNNMMKEEGIRQDILSLNSTLKSYANTSYRLNSAQSNSIIELTNNIAKSATKLEDTKGLIKTSVKKIKKNLKSGEKVNLTEAESNYISLNNAMNERYAYMSNIYANLEQIYRLLEIENNQQAPQTDTTTPENRKDAQQDNSSQGVKNIDTFKNEENRQNNSTSEPLAQPEPPIQQALPPYNNPNNPYIRGPFNPNRNTDTFYPRIRNIDTYRFRPNYYGYGYNNGYYNGQYYPNTISVQ